VKALKTILVEAAGFLEKTFISRSRYFFTQDYVFDRAHLWMQYLNKFRSKENVCLLEIGSYEGRSAVWFLENILTHPSARLTCIDPFFNRRVEIRFDRNLALSGEASKVTKIKRKSQDALKNLQGNAFDVIYIDGSHRAMDVEADAWLSWPLLKHGGVMIFDDYLWNMDLSDEERPQIAIDKFLRDFGPQIEILHKGYQVIVKRT